MAERRSTSKILPRMLIASSRKIFDKKNMTTLEDNQEGHGIKEELNQDKSPCLLVAVDPPIVRKIVRPSKRIIREVIATENGRDIVTNYDPVYYSLQSSYTSQPPAEEITDVEEQSENCSVRLIANSVSSSSDEDEDEAENIEFEDPIEEIEYEEKEADPEGAEKVETQLNKSSTLEASYILNDRHPKNILVLGGGGVKGIVEALLLRLLHFALQRIHQSGHSRNILEDLKSFINQDNYNPFEERSKISEQKDEHYDENAIPQLHKIFGIITGTSTGSIIASAISRLHWNPNQLIREAKTIAEEVFPTKWFLGRKFYQWASVISARFCQFSAKEIEEYLQSKFEGKQWKSNENECDEPILGMVAINKLTSKVQMFDSETYSESNVKIWEAIRASTAAPTYFPHALIRDHNLMDGEQPMKETPFVDGGLSANNPSHYTMKLLKANPKSVVGCWCCISCCDGYEYSESSNPLMEIFQLSLSNLALWHSFYESHPDIQDRLFRLKPPDSANIGKYNLAESDKVDEMKEKCRKSLKTVDDKYFKKIKDTASCLIANSIQIKSFSISDGEVKMAITMHYLDEEPIVTTCEEPKSVAPEVIKIDRKQAEPLELLIRMDDTHQEVHVMFEDHEVHGSPISVKVKVMQDDSE